MSGLFPRISRKSRTKSGYHPRIRDNFVDNWIRSAIADGRLQPNQRLTEAELTEALGVGRTAVRAALARLQHEGLVEHERHKGARVRLVEPDEAVEILEARAALEGIAARHAARRATGEDVEALRRTLAAMRARLDGDDLLAASDENARLHQKVLEIAAHATAARLVDTLNTQLVRFQYRTILLPGRAQRSYAEHAEIVGAIAARDPRDAERAMRAHLHNVAAALKEDP